jgi:predicted O-linked N-acetylglucosamine transferase (SPINDLY family)
VLFRSPIQVGYLGYPGTIGAPFLDYIIADPVLIPEESQDFYTEKIIYLPNSYQVNDAQRLISSHTPTKSEVGLPETGFVFCCFNSNYKITPAIFDSWSRILQSVQGSVLWLMDCNSTAKENLLKEAEARGIPRNRLVFAEHLKPADHLARHRLADLFIDTSPCNAHTTASDALWAGLPVLTLLGETFAGRVAASLLNAVGLPELIAKNQDEYEAMAIKLASNPNQLKALREYLEVNRLGSPLFNAQLSTRHIESAYEAIYSRRLSDLAPAHIYIPQ